MFDKAEVGSAIGRLGSAQANAIEPPHDRSEVEMALTEQSDALDYLRSTVERLAQRLAPALSNQSAKNAETSTKRPAMSAEIPEAIMIRAEEIRAHAYHLRELADRLTF